MLASAACWLVQHAGGLLRSATGAAAGAAWHHVPPREASDAHLTLMLRPPSDARAEARCKAAIASARAEAKAAAMSFAPAKAAAMSFAPPVQPFTGPADGLASVVARARVRRCTRARGFAQASHVAQTPGPALRLSRARPCVS